MKMSIKSILNSRSQSAVEALTLVEAQQAPGPGSAVRAATAAATRGHTRSPANLQILYRGGARVLGQYGYHVDSMRCVNN